MITVQKADKRRIKNKRICSHLTMLTQKLKSVRVYRKYVIFISMEVMKDAGNINVLWNNNQNAK